MEKPDGLNINKKEKFSFMCAEGKFSCSSSFFEFFQCYFLGLLCLALQNTFLERSALSFQFSIWWNLVEARTFYFFWAFFKKNFLPCFGFFNVFFHLFYIFLIFEFFPIFLVFFFEFFRIFFFNFFFFIFKKIHLSQDYPFLRFSAIFLRWFSFFGFFFENFLLIFQFSQFSDITFWANFYKVFSLNIPKFVWYISQDFSHFSHWSIKFPQIFREFSQIFFLLEI